MKANANVVIIPGAVPEAALLKGLLARWLRIDDFTDDLLAPLDLVEATRAAVSGAVSPRVLIQLAGGNIQSVHTNLPGVALDVIDYDNQPEAVADIAGLEPVLPPR